MPVPDPRRGRGLHRSMAVPCLLMLLAAPAWPAGISFDDAQRLALDRGPVLVASHARTEAAREEAARAAQLPDPRLTLGVSNLPVTGTDAFAMRADDMTMKQVGLMQDFPSRAKRRARLTIAERGTEQAEAMATAEALALRQATAEAWISLWSAQNELEVLAALRDPVTVALDAARARLAGGTGTATDSLAVKASALELENRIDEARARVEAARAGLARWLGSPALGLDTAGEPPALDALRINESRLLSSIDRIGPLLAWQAREALARANVAGAVAERRPDWSLGVSYGQRDRSRSGMSRSDMLMVEFSIGLPLFRGSRQDHGIAAQRAELAAVIAEREDARRAETEILQRALAEWRGLRRQVERKEAESLPLAHDRSRIALAAFAGGAELQPWLEARREEIELHIEHARHLGELGGAWASLAYLLPEEEIVP